MCVSAHTIAFRQFTLPFHKTLVVRFMGECAVQSSRKLTLSLVRGQNSTADPVGAQLPRIASGDEAAFSIFFEATNGLLFGLLLRILGHTQTAEEVLSELYEEVRSGDLVWITD